MASYSYWIRLNGGSGSTITVTRNNGNTDTADTIYWHVGSSTSYWATTSSDGVTNGQRLARTTPPTRSGFTFKGFYDTSASSGGTQYIGADGSLKTGSASNKTIYARWASNISLTLDRQSGTGGTAKLYRKAGAGGWYSDASCTSVATAITPPTRSGYRFCGYFSQTGGSGTKYIEPDGTFTASLDTYAPSSSKTIYAYWVQIAEVGLAASHPAYFPDGPYLYYCDGAFYSDADATTAITAITPPRSDSAVFLGCYLTNGTDGTQVIAPDGTISGEWTPSDGDTIYAMFRVVVQITLFPGTGGGDMSFFYDSADSMFHREDGDGGITAIVPPRFECRRFLGYYTESSGGGTKYIDADGTLLPALTSNPPGSSLTLYAYAPQVSYKILVDPQGGDGGMDTLYNDGSTTDLYPDDLCEEDPLAAVELPQFVGHDCTGLWTAESGGTKWVDDDGSIVHSEVLSDSLFLYAQWTPGTYTLTLDYSGGQGATRQISVTYGQAINSGGVNLPTPTPPKASWTFKGWYVQGVNVTSTTIWAWEDAIAVAEWQTPFGDVTDWFGMKSAALIPFKSDSGDTSPRVASSNGGMHGAGAQSGGIWRNPSVSYLVVKDVTVTVQLGKAWAAIYTGTGSTRKMAISGYMITSAEAETMLGEFPVVTISATANEGANAVNNFAVNGGKFNVSMPLVARARAQNLMDAVNGGGFLHRLTLRASCTPVVCEENLMPCASDIVDGVLDISAETLATDNEAAPTVSSGFVVMDVPCAKSGTDYTRYSLSARKEMV